MRFEILSRFRQGQFNQFELSDGMPLKIRIHPEDTPAEDMLIAIVRAAYNLAADSRATGFMGFASFGQPQSISVEDARRMLQVDSSGNAVGAAADYFKGRPLKLDIRASDECPGAFDMPTGAYTKHIGHVQFLIEDAQELLGQRR